MRNNDVVLRIGIDCDGVLADFDTAYQRELNRLGDTNIPPYEADCWHHERKAGFSHDTVERFWSTTARTDNFWLSLNPYGGQSLRDYLTDLSHTHHLFVVSKRPMHMRQATEDWVNYVLRVPNVVTLHSERKGHLAKGLDLHIMFDDKPQNLEQVKQHSQDTMCYLINQSWNKDWQNPSNIYRVDSIEQGMKHYYDHHAITIR